MEGRNVGTIGGESPKQGLTSAKDLPIELPMFTCIIDASNVNRLYVYPYPRGMRVPLP